MLRHLHPGFWNDMTRQLGKHTSADNAESLSLSSRRTDSTAIRPVTVGVPHANSTSREGQHDAA